jgi:hypothetical protein
VARVTLPAGCTGLDFADGGKTPPVRQGTSIEVSDQNAHYLAKSWYGQNGVIGGTGYSMGTKGGRWCVNHRPARLWNAWSKECPSCGLPTEPA